MRETPKPESAFCLDFTHPGVLFLPTMLQQGKQEYDNSKNA